MPLINPPSLIFVQRSLSILRLQPSFCLEYHIQPAPTTVPSSTPTTYILHNSPVPPLVNPPPISSSPITVPVTLRCSILKTKGTLASKRFQEEIYGPHWDQSFISTLPVPTLSETDSYLAYLADLNTDYDTVIINCSDHRDFVAKT